MEKNLKELFHKTGLPLCKCRKALKENKNNVEDAYYALSKDGMINLAM